MPKPPLTVVLTDGLGNQMFQYAAALAAALRRRLPLQIDATSGFQWNIHGRRFELDAFRLSAPVTVCPAHRLLHAATRTLEGNAMRFGHYHLAPLHYWISRHARSVTGFFQSPAYFQDAASRVRDEFQPAQALPSPIRQLASECAHPSTVGIHFRLAHALSASGTPVTPALSGPRYLHPLIAYYASAVAFIKQAIHHPRWLILTDSPSLDLTPFGISNPLAIRVANANHPPAWDQWLLSQCPNIIIGRSTFSWWAAWLSPHSGARICAPRIFRPGGSSVTPKDIYPSHWNLL